MGHADALWRRQLPHQERRSVHARTSRKATGNKLTITVHSNGSLIKHPEIKASVRRGVAPIGEVLISNHQNESPIYGVDSVPFLATSYAAARKLYAAQKPFLEKKLAEEGLVLLFSVPWPSQGIYAKKEIKSHRRSQGSEVPHLQHRDPAHRAARGRRADADRGAGHSDRVRHQPRGSHDHVALDRRRYQGMGLSHALPSHAGLAAAQRRDRAEVRLRRAAG
jgi:hypothetical protein